MRRRERGTTLVSGKPDGTPADSFTMAATLSADGRLAALAGGFAELTAVGTYWALRDLAANTFVPIVDGNPPPSILPVHSPVAAPIVIENGFPLLDVGFSADGSTLYLNEINRPPPPQDAQLGSFLEYDVTAGRVTRRVPGVLNFPRTFLQPALRDGRTLVYATSFVFGCEDTAQRIDRYDKVTGRVTQLLNGRVEAVASDASGRLLVYRRTGCTTPPSPAVSYLLDTRYGVPLPLPVPLAAAPMDDVGTTLFMTAADGVLAPLSEDSNGAHDIFAVDLPSRLDRDGDSLDDRWEVAMGLDFTSGVGPDGATGDPDGDGVTNLQEQTAGSHPRGALRQFLAEGADNAFFKTRVAIANPGAVESTAVVRFDGEDGTSRSVNVHVPAGVRRTVFVDEVGGTSASFSSVIDAASPLVIERTMSWDATEYGAHAERASPAPATRWFLAEGATGAFSLFYLLQNPGDEATTATIRYLRPTPLPPIERTYTLPARSRTTLPVDQQAPELLSTDVSASITSVDPILVERAMYRSVAGQPFAAGHASAGVTTDAASWFLAEGATGPFFDFFVLLANPNTSAADVEIRYLPSSGTVLTKTYTVAAESRRTIWVDGEDFPGLGRALDNVAVSCAITSTNAVPIVVERTMWFPGPAIAPVFWTEAHNSPGATATARTWVLADGEAGGTRAVQTYLLIANTSPTAGRVRVVELPDRPSRFDPAFDPAPASQTIDLPPNSRTTVPLHEAMPGRRFGVLVQSIETTPLADVVVERAMYWNVEGAVWAAGTNLLATPVP
jgi:hypothetical protein